eukprot:maker-scaffold526_size146413-snap-gene-0.25 protein:Tk11270 transcript:maker-scaffold526_size146413-snap-gene-0.25-mRNA-1 annotation:"flavodoxin"
MKSIRANPQIQDIIRKFNQKPSNSLTQTNQTDNSSADNGFLWPPRKPEADFTVYAEIQPPLDESETSILPSEIKKNRGHRWQISNRAGPRATGVKGAFNASTRFHSGQHTHASVNKDNQLDSTVIGVVSEDSECSCSDKSGSKSRGPKCWCQMDANSNYEPVGATKLHQILEQDVHSPKKPTPILKASHGRVEGLADASFISATQTELEDGQELYDKKVDVKNTQMVLPGLHGRPNLNCKSHELGARSKMAGKDLKEKARSKSQMRPASEEPRYTEGGNAGKLDETTPMDDRDVEKGFQVESDACKLPSNGTTGLKREESFARLNFDIVTTGSKNKKKRPLKKQDTWSKSKILLLLWTIVGLVLWVITYMILRLFFLI